MTQEEKIKELEDLYEEYEKEFEEIKNQASLALKEYLKQVQQKKLTDLRTQINTLYGEKN